MDSEADFRTVQGALGSARILEAWRPVLEALARIRARLEKAEAERDSARRDLGGMGAEVDARRKEAALAQGRAEQAEAGAQKFYVELVQRRVDVDRLEKERDALRAEVERLRADVQKVTTERDNRLTIRRTEEALAQARREERERCADFLRVLGKRDLATEVLALGEAR